MEVSLTWDVATDNVAVTGYKILRNGAEIDTSAITSYTDTSVLGGTTYTYTVRALGAAGNVSPDSSPASVTVPAGDTEVCHPAEICPYSTVAGAV